MPCIAPVTWYFSERFALANGISVVGGSIGMMVLPPITQYLLNMYGLRGTLLLISAFSYFGCFSGALMRKPRNTGTVVGQYTTLESSTVNAGGQNQDSSSFCYSIISFTKHLSRVLHTGIFADNPKLTLFQFIFAMYSVGYSTWVVFLVPHAVNKGTPSDWAVYLSTIGGLGVIIGRIGYGPLVDNGIISDIRLFLILSLLCAVTFLCDPLTDSYSIMCVFALVAGISIGARYPLSISITKSLVDCDAFISALGWTHFFTGIGKIFGPLITGLSLNNIERFNF